MIKDYMVWIVVAGVIVALLAVQLVFIGGIRAQAQQDHLKVRAQIQALDRLEKTIKDIPTKGDLAGSSGYLAQIRQESEDAALLWWGVTAGLEQGIDAKGTITDPETGEPIQPELFSETMWRHYLEMLRKRELNLSERLLGGWEELLTAYYAGTRPDLVTMEEVVAAAKADAPRYADYYARIYQADKLVGVKRDDDFVLGQPKALPAVTLRAGAWRRFLIARDLLDRVVPAAATEMPTRVTVRKYERPLAAQLINEDYTALKAVPPEEVKTIRMLRGVERIDKLEVTGPVKGDQVLAAPGDEEKGESAATPAPAAKAGKGATGAKSTPTYYDTFTVRMSFVAHPEVVDRFLREVMKSKDLYYAPVAVRVERYAETQTHAVFAPPPLESLPTDTAANAASLPVYGILEPAQPLVAAGADYEPPVRVMVVYEVVRFRFDDRFNP